MNFLSRLVGAPSAILLGYVLLSSSLMINALQLTLFTLLRPFSTGKWRLAWAQYFANLWWDLWAFVLEVCCLHHAETEIGKFLYICIVFVLFLGLVVHALHLDWCTSSQTRIRHYDWFEKFFLSLYIFRIWFR